MGKYEYWLQVTSVITSAIYKYNIYEWKIRTLIACYKCDYKCNSSGQNLELQQCKCNYQNDR